MAKTVFGIPRLIKITRHLKKIHWLRVIYKIARLSYHCHNQTAQPYVTDLTQKTPSHSCNTRSSSHTAPLFKRPAPHFNRPAPLFNRPAPLFNRPAPLFNRPAPLFNRPAPLFNRPAPLFNRSAPLLNRPAPLFNRPAPLFNRPAPLFNRPAHSKERIGGRSFFASFSVWISIHVLSTVLKHCDHLFSVRRHTRRVHFTKNEHFLSLCTCTWVVNDNDFFCSLLKPTMHCISSTLALLQRLHCLFILMLYCTMYVYIDIDLHIVSIYAYYIYINTHIHAYIIALKIGRLVTMLGI